MGELYLLHFVVRNITYTLTAGGFIVTCYTNYPVHLFKRETTTIPQKHVNTRMVRGAPMGTYIDQCFVVYTDIEQQEPGDTYTHTFIQEPWPFCQTRWFYFWGTVSGQLSPSCSAIFSKHRKEVPMEWIRCNVTTYDYKWECSKSSWPELWTAPSAPVAATIDYARSSYFTGRYKYMERSAIYFSTSPLRPGKEIFAAVLHITMSITKHANGGLSWLPSWQMLMDFPNPTWPPVQTDYNLIRNCNDVIYSRYCPDLSTGTINLELELPSHTLDTIIPGQIFAIAHRFGHDFYNVDPGWGKIFGSLAWRMIEHNFAYLMVQQEL